MNAGINPGCWHIIRQKRESVTTVRIIIRSDTRAEWKKKPGQTNIWCDVCLNQSLVQTEEGRGTRGPAIANKKCNEHTADSCQDSWSSGRRSLVSVLAWLLLKSNPEHTMLWEDQMGLIHICQGSVCKLRQKECKLFWRFDHTLHLFRFHIVYVCYQSSSIMQMCFVFLQQVLGLGSQSEWVSV